MNKLPFTGFLKGAFFVGLFSAASAWAQVPSLVHRWSFSGNYEDSVSGISATLIGSSVGMNESNTAVVLSGNGNGTGSLNLGTDILPTDVRDVTVEIWTTQTAVKSWARLWDYGSDSKNFFYFAWNNSTTADLGDIKAMKSNISCALADRGLRARSLNTPYHFSFVFKMNSCGSTAISWACRNTTTGAVESSGAIVAENWSLADLSNANFYLGHSQFTSDPDANAIYDEVRVWRGALTDEQLAASALAGPDKLAIAAEGAVPTISTWTGTVDDNASNAANWTPSLPDAGTIARFTGDFAAQIPAGTSFACAEVVFDNARLKADCDWRGLKAKLASGTLELAGRKLLLSQLDGEAAITDGGVPSGYEVLEYISANGKQWINTGITPECYDRIEMKLKFNDIAGTQALWCSRGTTALTNTFSCFKMDTGVLRFDRNLNSDGGKVLSPSADAVNTVVADGYLLACTLNGANAGAMAGKGGFTPGSPIALFGSHTAGTGLKESSTIGNWGKYRLYSFKIYGWTGGLKCDLVPVRRVSDGELGLYDRIGGTFLANMTETPFAAGEVVGAGADVADGELHIDVPSSETAVNNSVAISGKVKIVKEGAGSFTQKAHSSNVGVGRFMAGTFNIGNNRIVVDGLSGSGTVSASSLLANGGFETDALAKGAYLIKAPAGWNTSGTVRMYKDNPDIGYRQQNNSNWCYLDAGSSIAQQFSVLCSATYHLTLNMATWNSKGSYAKSSGNIKIDGKTVYTWSNMGDYNTATRCIDVQLAAGKHTIVISATSRSTAIDNVNIGGGVLEVNVPEGVTSENTGVAITGGALMQVWKTGKGVLLMSRENKSFGAGLRNMATASMVVKEGIVKQTATEGRASCGAQYGMIVVEDGAQFDLNGRVYHDYDYKIAGAGPDGSGALVNTKPVDSPYAIGGSKRGYLQDVFLAGDAVLGGPEKWALLFYNYGNDRSVAMNGHVLTIKNPYLFSESVSYAGAGKIVVDEDASLEFCKHTQKAPDCDVEVRGVLAVHDVSLTPVKSLCFTSTGVFSNLWETRPKFVVYEKYAPNTASAADSLQKHPKVELGAEGHFDTVLDISNFREPFDSSDLSFYAGTSVTVDLGDRTFDRDVLLVAWNGVPPDVNEFKGIGTALDNDQIAVAVRDDGLWAICLDEVRPATAEWTGRGEADNLFDPGNWSCRNVSGEELPGLVPADYTRVVVDGETTLNVPEGVKPPWGRFKIGDGQPKETQMGRIFYAADRYSNSAYPDNGFASISLDQYTAMGAGDLENLEGQNTVWQYSWLDCAQLRFDGWFHVGESQAGSWHITQSFDDYFGFAIDGEWVLFNRAYASKAEADCEVAPGWHRFTIVCGDTWGGQGSRDVTVDSVKTPMAICINGSSTPVSFSSSVFRRGSSRTVVKLGCDCDWRTQKILLENGALIDLNGHVLKVSNMECDGYIGASIVNTGDSRGELHYEVAEGKTMKFSGVTLKGNVKLVKTGPGTLVMCKHGNSYEGGTLVKEGVLKSEVMGVDSPFGYANLLKNGGFDDGTVGNNSGNYSYADGGNGYDNPYWTTSLSVKSGLAKANGTWVASGRSIGKYAYFLQSNSGISSDVMQSFVVPAPGKYRYSFRYAGRPKYLGATTQLRLIRNGSVQTLASVTPTADTYSICEGEVELYEAGEYTLQFCQEATSSDKANTIDDVVFAKCDASGVCGAIEVEEGGVFDVNGKCDFAKNIFVLAGGTFRNAQPDVTGSWAQIKYMCLTEDSVLDIQDSYGFVGNSYTRCLLDLGGKTLSVNLNADGKNFYLYNTEVRNGTLDVLNGGWLEVAKSGLFASDASIKCAAALRVSAPVDVRDYMAYRESSDHNEGTSVFKVRGVFAPVADYFYGCTMADGSTIDLSYRTKPLSVTSSVSGGSKVLLFEDDSKVAVDFNASRDKLKELMAADDAYVVKWTGETAPAESVKFVSAAGLQASGYRLKREVDGLKLVPNGFKIVVR